MFCDFSSISWFWRSNKTQLFTRPKYRYTGITGIFFPVYRYRNFLIPNIPRLDYGPLLYMFILCCYKSLFFSDGGYFKISQQTRTYTACNWYNAAWYNVGKNRYILPLRWGLYQLCTITVLHINRHLLRLDWVSGHIPLGPLGSIPGGSHWYMHTCIHVQ